MDMVADDCKGGREADSIGRPNEITFSLGWVGLDENRDVVSELELECFEESDTSDLEEARAICGIEGERDRDAVEKFIDEAIDAFRDIPELRVIIERRRVNAEGASSSSLSRR